MQKNAIIQAVLFDLDGTLLDTAQDLVNALNQLTDKPMSMTPELRAAAGRGCKAFIKAGLNIHEDDSRYPVLAEKLLNYYHDHLLDTTQLFSGMHDVLNHLDEAGIPWGIVTNKAEKYTHKILDGLNLSARAKCIISGDSVKNRKPHPEPLLQACSLVRKLPQHCLYVGDSETDILASKAAGASSLVALYGYIPLAEDPLLWNADGYIQHPKEILNFILPS
jgi:2-phosphoglycolate phosphatase